MKFRLGSLFAISSVASAVVVASATTTTPVSANPPWQCSAPRYLHASHCVKTQWSQGNLEVLNNGQIANTSNLHSQYICPIPQIHHDINTHAWPGKAVELRGWANSAGVAVEVCAVPASGGQAYCTGVTEHASNQVHWTWLDASSISGYDYMFLRVSVPGVTNGSMNTFFGYSMVTYGNEYSSC